MALIGKAVLEKKIFENGGHILGLSHLIVDIFNNLSMVSGILRIIAYS